MNHITPVLAVLNLQKYRYITDSIVQKMFMYLMGR